MSVFGDGEPSRAFSYSGDIALVISSSIQVPEAYNRIFNIGGRSAFSVNDLANVTYAMGVEPQVFHKPARNEVAHAYSSHDKVNHVFGSQSMTNLDEGLGQMAQWVKQYGARKSQKFDNFDGMKNFSGSLV